METELSTLQTERLLLQKLTPEDHHHVFGTYSDEAIKEFFGLNTDDALQVEKQRYKAGMATFNRSFVNFQLMDKRSGKIIGGCGFHTWYLQHARTEIGYQINDEANRGKGLMREAMKAIIDYGFYQMHLNRIEAFIGQDNVPSLRLVRSLGFIEEGRLRQHYCKNGRMEDSLVFALLRDEYKLF